MGQILSLLLLVNIFCLVYYLVSARILFRQRRQLEESKSEFLSILSHELKTPLTSMTGYGEILYRYLMKKQDVLASKITIKMNLQISSLSRLMDELLNLSIIDNGGYKPKKVLFNLNRLVRETAEEIEAASGIRRITVKGQTEELVYGDQRQIRQVIFNLLLNSVKFSRPASPILLHYRKNEKNLLFKIKDEGFGIPEEHHERIFEKFYQIDKTRRKDDPSLGLGLYLSREMVRRHGGRIWFESREGQGSSFYFTLTS